MLIGNKIDLDNLKSVHTEEAQLFAKENECLFFETSALEATNVEKAFNQIITEICEKFADDSDDEDDDDASNQKKIHNTK